MPGDEARGDATGLAFPARPEALLAAGPAFLTEAFRRFGALAPDNAVTAITGSTPCAGGSTGQKLLLSLAYARPEPGLGNELFVKFSRDFTDPVRDLGKQEMESEVRLAALSRHPAFPVAVPRTYFADYEHETGTGILITDRIDFGGGGIEPQKTKCSDYELDDPLAYYRAVMIALARLAAAHKSGRLGDEVEAAFPFDAESAITADPIRWSEDKLQGLVAIYADFAARCPALLPAHLRSPEFIARFETQALDVLRHETAIKRYLHTQPEYIALCHWNAQLDNAWFWRDEAGVLQCGLIDWGRVRQLNLAYALWGCLVGADLWIWDDHLDELLGLFIAELHGNDGPLLDLAELRLHLQLYAATIGIAGILIAPGRILARRPEAVDAADRFDPLIRDHEEVRCFLHILTVFLNLWAGEDFTRVLDLIAVEVASSAA